MTKTALLLGNGIFDSGIKHYKEYVDEFVEFANKNKIDRVIIAGGHTHSPQVVTSEASSIKRYVAPKLNRRIKLILEDKSLSASQCIKLTKPLLRIRNGDDVTVFCDSVIAVKVMWFIMHYWFGLSRKEIEDDAMDYINAYYSNKYGTWDMGKSLVFRGIHFKNVEVHPCTFKPSVEGAVAQQLVSLVDISALYNRKLYDTFIKATRQRYSGKKITGRAGGDKVSLF